MRNNFIIIQITNFDKCHSYAYVIDEVCVSNSLRIASVHDNCKSSAIVVFHHNLCNPYIFLAVTKTKTGLGLNWTRNGLEMVLTVYVFSMICALFFQLLSQP